jgi:hypothetical protein
VLSKPILASILNICTPFSEKALFKNSLSLSSTIEIIFINLMCGLEHLQATSEKRTF